MDEIRERLLETAKKHLEWTVVGILDALFLIVWVVVQYIASRAIAYLELTGVDKWVFLIFQILFAISTLVHPFLSILKDSWIMGYRTWQEIRRKHEEIGVQIQGEQP